MAKVWHVRLRCQTSEFSKRQKLLLLVLVSVQLSQMHQRSHPQPAKYSRESPAQLSRMRLWYQNDCLPRQWPKGCCLLRDQSWQITNQKTWKNYPVLGPCSGDGWFLTFDICRLYKQSLRGSSCSGMQDGHTAWGAFGLTWSALRVKARKTLNSQSLLDLAKSYSNKVGGFCTLGKIGRRVQEGETHSALWHLATQQFEPFCLGFWQSQVVPNAPLRARPVHQQELLSLPSRNSTLLPDSEPEGSQEISKPCDRLCNMQKDRECHSRHSLFKVKLAHAAKGS